MRIFITGATGTIGSRVAEVLAENGHDVVALARSRASVEALKRAGYRVEQGDMTRPSDWRAEASRADAIIHTAMLRRSLRAGRGWLRRAGKADVSCLEGLVEAARAGRRCRALIETSGTALYGDQGRTWVDESTPPNPSQMGRFHLAGEQVVRAAARTGLPTCSLRLGLVYGNRGLFASGFLAPASKGVGYVVGSGTNLVSPVHIDDVARAYRLAVENPPVEHALNIVDDQPLELTELAQRVLDGLGGGRVRRVPRALVTLLAGHPIGEMVVASARCTNTRARQRLGWEPRFPTVREGLADVIEAFRRSKL